MSKKRSMWKVFAKINTVGSDQMTCIAEDVKEAAERAEEHFHRIYGDRDTYLITKVEHLGTED